MDSYRPPYTRLAYLLKIDETAVPRFLREVAHTEGRGFRVSDVIGFVESGLTKPLEIAAQLTRMSNADPQDRQASDASGPTIGQHKKSEPRSFESASKPNPNEGVLTAQLRNGGVTAKFAAVKAIVRLRLHRLGGEVLHCLQNNSNLELRLECALALAELQYVPALPALAAIANGADTHAEIRAAASHAIDLIGGPIPQKIEGSRIQDDRAAAIPASEHGRRKVIVGGDHLRAVLEPLGYVFMPNGNDASHGKPAWFLVAYEKRTHSLNMPADRRRHGDGYPDS